MAEYSKSDARPDQGRTLAEQITKIKATVDAARFAQFGEVLGEIGRLTGVLKRAEKAAQAGTLTSDQKYILDNVLKTLAFCIKTYQATKASFFEGDTGDNFRKEVERTIIQPLEAQFPPE